MKTLAGQRANGGVGASKKRGSFLRRRFGEFRGIKEEADASASEADETLGGTKDLLWPGETGC